MIYKRDINQLYNKSTIFIVEKKPMHYTLASCVYGAVGKYQPCFVILCEIKYFCAIDNWLVIDRNARVCTEWLLTGWMQPRQPNGEEKYIIWLIISATGPERIQDVIIHMWQVSVELRPITKLQHNAAECVWNTVGLIEFITLEGMCSYDCFLFSYQGFFVWRRRDPHPVSSVEQICCLQPLVI